MQQLSGNWQQRSVAEFLAHLNWLGLPVADTPTLEPAPINWHTVRVSEFWQRVNWLGLVSSVPPATTSPTEWSRYHVKDFFGRMNWQGIGVILPVNETLAAGTASDRPVSAAWPAWSVATFFGQLNWDGRPDQAIALEPGVSLWRRSVAEFCAGIPWSGQPIIAQVSKSVAAPAPPVEPEFTLSDLSTLF
ncbi:hypothetical protein [Parathermosynechococcus lividus]